MELHSYAKIIKKTSRSWTIDQRRKLVENRITLDVLFNKNSFNLYDSWKKLMKVSNFDGFDISFVRTQWTNILLKYKNLVQRHTKDSSNHMTININDDIRDSLTAEWEFFEKIYRWVKHKQKLQPNCSNVILKEIEDESNDQQQSKINSTKDESSPDDNCSVLSSSIEPSNSNGQNIIHPKTSRNISNNNNNNNNIPNTSQENQINNNNNNINKNYGNGNLSSTILQQNPHAQQQILCASTATGSGIDLKSKKLKKKKINKLRKRRNHNRKYSNLTLSAKKIERKMSAFCQIFAQIVEKDYPNINVDQLLTDNDESIDSSSSSD